MILATRHGDREYRAAGEWGTEHVIPSPISSAYGSPETLPAVGAAIRLITGTIASLPLCVYSGELADRKKHEDAWQYQLLEYPNDEVSGFTFLADVVSSLESCGNAFIFKSRMPRQRQIGALSTLHPARMTVRRDQNTNELVYELWNGRETIRIPRRDVLHIRGDTLGGGDIGYSPIQVHRLTLNNMQAQEQFQGRHYQNDARPGVALLFPHGVNKEQADRWGQAWDARHAGPANRGRTAVLGGGGTIQTFPLSLEDQQFVESQHFSVEEVARMFGVPKALLEEGDQKTAEEESLRFLKFCLLPRMNRIEDALKADPDLFGPDQPLYPEFEPDEFLKGDAVSMATVAHEKVQSGIWLVDEARAKEGLPPLPDGAGQIPQLTPVGGAPNPTPPQE